MKALLLLCLVTSVAKANHPHHHHHMSHSTGSGQFVHSLAYKLPGAASFFRIKQVFPSFGHHRHHEESGHQMENNHSSPGSPLLRQGKSQEKFTPFSPRYAISRLEVSDEEWQAELAESFAESGLLNSENSILTQVPRGLVNINFDTHACVHMGTHLKVSTCAERPTQVSYPLAGDPSSNQLHTLVMLDIDSEEGPYLHWMVDNIPGSKVEKGHTVAQYVTPHPPLVSENPHRYMVVVMEQNGGETAVGADDAYNGAGPCQDTGRQSFNLQELRNKYNLGEVIAANYFQVDFDPEFAPKCEASDPGSVLA